MSSYPISIHTSVLAACVLCLVGCSASDYSKPIATFADATKNADAALADLNKTVTAQYTDFLSQRARTDLHVAVTRKDGECDLKSERCRIVLREGATEQVFPPDPLLGNMVAVMADINSYAQNLNALVADDSAEKAATDVNAALGSVEALANTVSNIDKKEKKNVPSFATPVGSAVNWLLGQYVNHVKLEGLRVATREAKPVIERAAAIFANAAVFGSDPQRADLTKSFQDKFDTYTDNRSSEADLKAAVDAAKLYDDFLRSKPGETFAKMGKAHTALAEALDSPNPSWPQVIGQVQSFAKQAAELAAIAKSLAALGEKNKGENK